MCSALAHVRFAPNSDRKSGFAHEVMSALPPKADIIVLTAIQRHQHITIVAN